MINKGNKNETIKTSTNKLSDARRANHLAKQRSGKKEKIALPNDKGSDRKASPQKRVYWWARKPKEVLAREFYWCDEHDFYLMDVPTHEAGAFAEQVYGPEDALLDVYKFFPRIWQAQEAARRYLYFRLLLSPT